MSVVHKPTVQTPLERARRRMSMKLKGSWHWLTSFVRTSRGAPVVLIEVRRGATFTNVPAKFTDLARGVRVWVAPRWLFHEEVLWFGTYSAEDLNVRGIVFVDFFDPVTCAAIAGEATPLTYEQEAELLAQVFPRWQDPMAYWARCKLTGFTLLGASGFLPQEKGVLRGYDIPFDVLVVERR